MTEDLAILMQDTFRSERMNERFRKLAEEVFFDESTNGAGQKMYMFGELKMQKFSELIVRECARQVNCYEALNIFEHFGLSSTSEPQRPAPLDSSYPDGDGYWK